MQKKRIKKFSFFRIYSFPNTLSLAILLGFLFKNSTSDRLLGPCFIVAASQELFIRAALSRTIYALNFSM